jgi:[FeFe] hydrogenase H-cluster maturation GTPase HydF
MREKILGDLVDEGGLVLLVMPQDIQAPKGRLILPQVQTIRELLDRKCTAVSTTVDGIDRALSSLNRAPDLIITDSQCFKIVYEKKPAASALTSFSILFAAYKGDLNKFMAGTSQLGEMTEKSRVLIAEACTHVPMSEDIGRVKIPNLLRKRFGEGLEIVNVCGNDFPKIEELAGFDLVIHCGACMFNRKHVMNRIAAAEAAGVPITNYGVVLAELTGILDKVKLPE